MNRFIACLTITATLACSSIAWSQATDPAQHKREAALDDLLSERGPEEALQKAIQRAEKAGVTKQAILEARFLYHVDMLEDAKIAAMLPEFLEQQKKFKIEESAIFALKEDWLSVVEYVKAIDALQKGDREGFKKHIKEAFWLGPRQASAFAPHIERLRHKEAMSAIKFDFNRRLATLDGKPPVALDTVIKERKALLLHFWSPHSRECVASMDDFASTAQMLVKQGIAVVSLCAQRSAEANAVAHEFNKGGHGQWLVDPDEKSLGVLLRVQNLPTMALIDPNGRVMFSGDPTDEHFWRMLEQIEPKIKRPDIDREFEE